MQSLEMARYYTREKILTCLKSIIGRKKEKNIETIFIEILENFPIHVENTLSPLRAKVRQNCLLPSITSWGFLDLVFLSHEQTLCMQLTPDVHSVAQGDMEGKGT